MNFLLVSLINIPSIATTIASFYWWKFFVNFLKFFSNSFYMTINRSRSCVNYKRRQKACFYFSGSQNRHKIILKYCTEVSDQLQTTRATKVGKQSGKKLFKRQTYRNKKKNRWWANLTILACGQFRYLQIL